MTLTSPGPSQPPSAPPSASTPARFLTTLLRCSTHSPPLVCILLFLLACAHRPFLSSHGVCFLVYLRRRRRGLFVGHPPSPPLPSLIHVYIYIPPTTTLACFVLVLLYHHRRDAPAALPLIPYILGEDAAPRFYASLYTLVLHLHLRSYDYRLCNVWFCGWRNRVEFSD